MATTESRNGKAQMDYKPTSYNVKEMPPITDTGKYEAKIEKVGRDPAKNTGLPQLQIQWKLKECLDDQDARNLGDTVFDRITFFPEGDKAGRFGKIQLQTLLTACGLDFDLVPQNISSKVDFDELVDALVGQTISIWVTHTQSKDDPNQKFVNARYDEPKGRGGIAAASSGDEDEDDDRDSGRSTKTASKGSSSKATKRR